MDTRTPVCLHRSIHLAVPEPDLERRREAMDARGQDGWRPSQPRQRLDSKALRAYARFATSAAFGAVRDVDPVAVQVPSRG